MADLQLANLAWIIRAFRRQFRWIALGTLVCTLAAVVFVLVVEETYESHATLLLERPRLKDSLAVDTGEIDIVTFRDLTRAGSVVEGVLNRLRWQSRAMHTLYASRQALVQARKAGFPEIVGSSPDDLRRRLGDRLGGDLGDYQLLAALTQVQLEGLADLDPRELAQLRVDDLARVMRAESQVIEETNISKQFSNKIDLYVTGPTGPAAKLFADTWTSVFLEMVEESVEGGMRDAAHAVIGMASAVEATVQQAERVLLREKNELLIELKEQDLLTRSRILFGPPVPGQDAPLMQQLKLAEAKEQILAKEIEELDRRINAQLLGTTWIGDATPGSRYYAGLIDQATCEVRRILEARRRLDEAHDAVAEFRRESELAAENQRLANLEVLLATAALDLYQAERNLLASRAALVELATQSSAPGLEDRTLKLRRASDAAFLYALLSRDRGLPPPKTDGTSLPFDVTEEELDPAYASLREGVGRLAVEKEHAGGMFGALTEAHGRLEVDFAAQDAKMTVLRQREQLFQARMISAERALAQFRTQFNDDLSELARKRRELEQARSNVRSLTQIVETMDADIRAAQQELNQAQTQIAMSERELSSRQSTWTQLQPALDSARQALDLSRTDIRGGPPASLPDRRTSPKRSLTVAAAAILAGLFFSFLGLAAQFIEDHHEELLGT